MRKFLGNVALEARHDGIALEEDEVAVITAETAISAVEVAQDLNEVDRLVGVSDGLEDLAVIADNIDEASATDVALVENSAQMAVAGTDVAPEEMIPEALPEPIEGAVASEAYRGRKIATEGIREVAKTIWENIKSFLKKIWEKIEGFFYKIVGTIPTMRRKLETLRKRVDDTSGKVIDNDKKTIKITSGVAILSIDYKPVKEEAALKTSFSKWEETVKKCYGAYTTSVSKAGESLANAIRDFDVEASSNSLKTVCDAFDSANVGKVFTTGTELTGRFNGFKTLSHENLFGNHTLASKTPSTATDTAADAILTRAELSRNTAIVLIPTSDKTKDIPTDFEMKAISTSAMSDLIKTADNLLDTLEEYSRGKAWKEIVKQRKAIETASDKAQKAFDKYKESDAKSLDNTSGRTSETVAHYRAALNFNQAFARMVSNPAQPLYTNSLTLINAITSVISKSLACYK